ncbi:hypothetical protein E2C01_075357 [Portunus trituberculatus]|uniref:Uncharacterized protein n=1 Tax=Portunus trituberculatus TaxID=210409 RepID=A0A5B7IEW4_PORTR|nr:hypothetical protein [Portunus trituberculatus]
MREEEEEEWSSRFGFGCPHYFANQCYSATDAGGGFPPARCSWREGCAPTPARANRLTPPSQPHTGPPCRHRRFSSRSRAPLAPSPPPSPSPPPPPPPPPPR